MKQVLQHLDYLSPFGGKGYTMLVVFDQYNLHAQTFPPSKGLSLSHSLSLSPVVLHFSPFLSSLSCADHALGVLSTSFNVMQLSFEEST